VSSGFDASALQEIPVVRVESATADGQAEDSVILEELAKALVRLGHSRREARARMKRAYEGLQRRGEDATDEQRLLTVALSAR